MNLRINILSKISRHKSICTVWFPLYGYSKQEYEFLVIEIKKVFISCGE